MSCHVSPSLKAPSRLSIRYWSKKSTTKDYKCWKRSVNYPICDGEATVISSWANSEIEFTLQSRDKKEVRLELAEWQEVFSNSSSKKVRYIGKLLTPDLRPKPYRNWKEVDAPECDFPSCIWSGGLEDLTRINSNLDAREYIQILEATIPSTRAQAIRTSNSIHFVYDKSFIYTWHLVRDGFQRHPGIIAIAKVETSI